MNLTRNARVIAATATLGVVALVAGCGGSSTPAEEPSGDASSESTSASASEPASEPVTIEYFNFSSSPDHEEQLAAIVDAFETENPDITVNVTTEAYDNYFTQLKTRTASNTAPDTFEVDYQNFVSFVASGALLDLTDGLDSSRYASGPYGVFAYEGKQYGAPESFSDLVLAYNTDLFDAAGLDYPTSDWTWADETAAAEQLADKSAGVFGDFQPVQFYEFYKSLAQNGGEFFNADKTKATFNSPEGVEAAEWLIGKVGTTMPTDAELGGQGESQLFQSNKLAMMHMGIWAFSELQEMPNWDIAVEPGNTHDSTEFFANAAVASVGTAHPEAAAKWIQFLTSSDEMVQQRLDSAWEIPAIADESKLSGYLDNPNPPANRQAVFDALESVVVPPVIERQTELQDTVTAALQEALQGTKTVQQALDDAVVKVDALLG